MSRSSVLSLRHPQSPSLPPHHPRHRGSDHDIVERVIEMSLVDIVYPTLTHSNYTEWSLVMKVNLQVARLWDAIEYGDGDYRDERSALAAILQVVPVEMQASLAIKAMTHDAWEAI
jgi:hypothetical protein